MFSPGIPIIGVIKAFIIFYLKELSLLKNMAPPDRNISPHLANAVFSLILLIAYALCIIPVVYVLAQMTPSTTCGPFRIYSKMYDIIPITIDSWPSVIRSVLNVFISAAILIPFFVILVLSIYYLRAMVNSYKEMVDVLKEQLQMEGQDKQFLIKRITELTGGGKKKDKPDPNKPDTIPENPPAYQTVDERRINSSGGVGNLG